MLKILNILNKNIIKIYFNKWKKIISKNKKMKKRIVKRNGYKKNNKKKNEIIKVKKIIDNIEILRNIMHRWKNNAYNIKLNDDYKNILTSIKIQNKENSEKSEDNNRIENKNKKINSYDNLNEDLLNRLKKVSLHLILSKYQKIRDLLLKKYFYKWKNNIITKNIKKKNKKLIREISKYIRKKVGFCFKKKENEINNIKKHNKEKTFAKKKTKLNLYKERIKHYKKFIQNYPENPINNNNNNFEASDVNNTSAKKKFVINVNTPETNKLNNDIIINENIIETNKLDNNNLIINGNTPETGKINNNNNFIINKISNFTEPRYIIKKPGRRNISQNKIKTKNLFLENDYYNINQIHIILI